MTIQNKTFQGVMNLDDPNSVVPNGHHKYAKNGVFRGTSPLMSFQSVVGNSIVANSNLHQFGSTNQCIGSHFDELKQRLFYWNYNSAGYNSIYFYDLKTNSITPLLISYIDSAEDLFGFDPKYPIASANILYRTEEDGDILLWTDRLNRPMKLNIKDATISGKTYGSNWKKKYLTVARPMPLISPICSYETDLTTNANNLKNQLFLFRYRWVYKDNTKSAWGPWGKMFAPVSADSLSNETTNTTDNRINVQLETGDSDVVKIEIAAKNNVASSFTDPYLIATLDKSLLSIGNNTIYNYKFYNNGSYESIDLQESQLLFDYCPKTANAQELLNGNIIAYAGIKEGANFNPSLNISVEYPQVNISGTQALTINMVEGSTYRDPSNGLYKDAILFTFNGSIDSVTNVTLNCHYNFPLPIQIGGYQVISRTALYTKSSGDTIATMIDYIKNYFNDIGTGFKATTGDIYNVVPPNSLLISHDKPSTELALYGSTTITYDSNAVTDVNNSIYKPGSRYGFGMVYFDEFGVTNGVVTNDVMSVIVPEAVSNTLGTATADISGIKFSINHAPPVGATRFSFVRTENLSIKNMTPIISENVIKGDSTADKYIYFDINSYQTNTNGYPLYDFAKGDRVRILGRKNIGSSFNIVKDYPILDLVQGITPTPWMKGDGTALRQWIKIPYDSTVMGSWGTSGWTEFYLELYTPTSVSDIKVYYEFGETYKIGTDINGNSVHLGQSQSQVIGTGSQPAIFDFIRGDYYQRTRLNPYGGGTIYIIDQSVSDKYDSKLVGNGRPFVIDPYAKETFYPTLIRYSDTYEQNTNINNTNRFYPANMDEYDRERGSVQRLVTRGRQLRVFQNRGVGMVPIYQNVMQTADGNDVVTQNMSVINKIQYYQGEFGIGDQYCSLASSAQADYFTDPVIGAQIRLSVDGMTSLTETYKAHYTLSPILSKYNSNLSDKFGNGGYAKILGVYDVFEEHYTTCLQGSSNSELVDTTISFSETRNCYSLFYDYYPEWIANAGNVLISWKNGNLWIHNNTSQYANFYGVQYYPSIKLVFNGSQNIKKHFQSITTLGNTVWAASTQGDINTSLGHQSKLIQSDFIDRDGKKHATFKRDMNSTGGLYNGKPLKGDWIELNLKPVNPQSLVDLYYVDITIQNPLNNR